jgi:nitrosocyanin
VNERRRAKLDGGRSELSAAEGGTIRGRRPMKRTLLLAVVVAVVLVAVACGVRTTHKHISAAKVGAETGWKGGPVHVKKGDKVVIEVGNTTTKTHGFSIDAFGIKQTVDPGKKISVKLAPTAAGHYVIYCQLHPAHLKTELDVT